MLRKMTPEKAAEHTLREMAETAAIAFLARQWTYYRGGGNEFYIPDPEELEATIKRLVHCPATSGAAAESERIKVTKDIDGLRGVSVFLRLGEFSGEEIKYV